MSMMHDDPTENIHKQPVSLFRIIVVGIGSCIFLLFGIERLWGSYQLTNPHYFILTFFASNLIILISMVGFIYVVITVVTSIRTARRTESGNDTKQ